ncbi:hypothetical protein R7V47_02495 [Mesomycoplasma ovipneumoniae]|uniref:hypothetical protein n=1 Tax=Mesomycoplasma ovipneumoniae TaxID=29562 RepID=UPI0029649B4A|nr:hypothetical protein [Mesomycoplasma ovipneumoniae]MDW2907870.1 hypothetical protein [Mesomycoplasma ovipneumoniae]MDW2920148.1 hypothetical protein [Mesomycoplasma ovipneumoniae]MDW2927216.1 hypothetical protein [Mesomycoplasma ovipneumoniae]
MSRHFKKDEFDMIYKIYNEFGLKKTINYINDISPDTNFITIFTHNNDFKVVEWKN